MTSWQRLALAIGTVAGITACGGGAAVGGSERDAGGASAGSGRTSGGGSSEGTLEVTVERGPFAGRHEVTARLFCFAQDDVWGTNLQVARESGITEAGVMLTGLSSSGGRTERVELGVTFGQLHDMSGNAGLIGIGGAVGGGSGAAQVQREGSGAVIRIQGTAQTGSPIVAVFRCSHVE